MNARTYIHSLPDAPLILDPAAHTVLDSKNELGEYLTSKISLCSLADFTILSYTYTDFFKESEEANTWVNLNSSNMKMDMLYAGSSSLNVTTTPLCAYANSNYPVSILVNNYNPEQNASSEITFKNDTISNRLAVGIQSSNYFNPIWTIGSPGDSYIYTRDSNLQIGTRDQNDLLFYTGGGFVGSERLIIKGDGTGFVGINTKNPRTSLTVNGTISTNNIIIDDNNNSDFWFQGVQYVKTNSAIQLDLKNTFQSISSQLLLKTGGIISGPIITTKTNANAFLTNELVSKRYVDALALETSVSGNFIPSLYYSKTETDDFLVNPNQAYTYIEKSSSSDLQSKNFVFANSSSFVNINNLFYTLSSNWNSVYSNINQNSSNELNQNEASSFVFLNSASLINTRTRVNGNYLDWNSVYSYTKNASSNLNSSYTYLNNISSNELQVRSFINNNSSSFIDLRTTTWQTSSRWLAGYTYTRDFSAKIQETNTHVQETSSIIDNFIEQTNNSSYNWNSVYSNVNAYSSTYVSNAYLNSKFLPNSGGNITGNLKVSGVFYADTFGVGNFQSANTLGTLIGKIQLFNSNNTSIGFLPIYDNIN